MDLYRYNFIESWDIMQPNCICHLFFLLSFICFCSTVIVHCCVRCIGLCVYILSVCVVDAGRRLRATLMPLKSGAKPIAMYQKCLTVGTGD